MRFRRKAKLFLGVYLNFSKTGISTTIGVPGASINVGKQGTYLNTGIQGTGIYDRKRIGSKNNTNNDHSITPQAEVIDFQENIRRIFICLRAHLFQDFNLFDFKFEKFQRFKFSKASKIRICKSSTFRNFKNVKAPKFQICKI